MLFSDYINFDFLYFRIEIVEKSMHSLFFFFCRNVETNVKVECSWPPRVSVSFVLVEHIALVALSLLVTIVLWDEPHPKGVPLPLKNARCLSVYQVQSSISLDTG